NFPHLMDGYRTLKKRHNLHSYKKQGETNSTPIDQLLQFRQELKQVISEFDESNVFNYDETALYYKLEPTKTLAHGQTSGKKQNKERVTLLVTASAKGEKLPLLIDPPSIALSWAIKNMSCSDLERA